MKKCSNSLVTRDVKTKNHKVTIKHSPKWPKYKTNTLSVVKNMVQLILFHVLAEYELV